MMSLMAMAVVVVLDTGLDLNDTRFKDHLCRWGHRDFTGEGIADRHGHGTHVAGLIQEYAGESNYCMLIVKYYGKEKDNYIEALRYSISLRPAIINISGGGNNLLVPELLVLSQNRALIVAAAGNEGEDLSKHPFYPASYNFPNIIPVACTDCDTSNYGTKVKKRERGNHILSTLPNGQRGFLTGTSQATAIATGKMLYEFH